MYYLYYLDFEMVLADLLNINICYPGGFLDSNVFQSNPSSANVKDIHDFLYDCKQSG